MSKFGDYSVFMVLTHEWAKSPASPNSISRLHYEEIYRPFLKYWQLSSHLHLNNLVGI